MTAEEITAIEQNADEVFLLDNWLPDAAKRSGQLSLVSHPSKFSHPSAKSSAIIAESKKSTDGFLRTGNVRAKLDVFGNAAAMDVFKFLSLELSDGKTILEHLELNSEKIKNDLQISSASFDKLSEDFLVIKKLSETALTSEKVKQVYFPVTDGCYHLLSILTPSGLLFELKNRIQKIRFSDQAKQAREDKKKLAHNDAGFDDLYGLTMIYFGGAHPKNISVLNSANGGKSYLLPSLPPSFKQQHQRLPKNNFFDNILWSKEVKDIFILLHELFKTDYNNKNIREGRDAHIQSLVDYIIEKMWLVRSQLPEWSNADNFELLPKHQKIWLDDLYKDVRGIEEDWLNKIITECARWIIATYESVIGNDAILLADDELKHIKKIIQQNEESFR